MMSALPPTDDVSTATCRRCQHCHLPPLKNTCDAHLYGTVTEESSGNRLGQECLIAQMNIKPETRLSHGVWDHDMFEAALSRQLCFQNFRQILQPLSCMITATRTVGCPVLS